MFVEFFLGQKGLGEKMTLQSSDFFAGLGNPTSVNIIIIISSS